MFKVRKNILAAAFFASTVMIPVQAMSENLMGALAKTYQNNATLNSSRAGVRVTDEGVAIAKSGYRPTVNGTYSATRSRSHSSVTGNDTYSSVGRVGIELNQMLFDGFQTKNNVAAAESQVFAQRENLLNDEMNSLFDGVSAYMDVYMYRQVAALRERNLAAMNEQVRSAQARLEVGEGTRTDVAQADASRSNAIAQLNAAKANVKSAEAQYRQVVGVEPGKLDAASPISKLLPASTNSAFSIASQVHPGILATQYAVDAAGYTVKSNEGSLLPGVSLSAKADRTDTYAGTKSNADGNTASVGVNVKIPIYQGGRTSAIVRQSKEQLGQRRIEVDVIRDQVRQGIGSAWAQLEAAKANVAATRDGIAAAQLALDGVIEERNVGQRTTLDVLNSQNDLVDVQITAVLAQRDTVVASYALLNATGRLTAKHLGLKVTEYKPEQHYNAVKDKWIGLRTPDGR